MYTNLENDIMTKTAKEVEIMACKGRGGSKGKSGSKGKGSRKGCKGK